MTEEEQGLFTETLEVKDSTSAQIEVKDSTSAQIEALPNGVSYQAPINLIETEDGLVAPTNPIESGDEVVATKLESESPDTTCNQDNSLPQNDSDSVIETTEPSDGLEDVMEEVLDLASDEKENTGDSNECPADEPNRGITCPKEESDMKEEIKEEVYDASYNEADFQPKVIKLVNMKGEPFMCQVCGYQSRHLRWLRYHETICQKQGPPAIPKGTLIFARPAGMGQQLMINSDLVNMVYPGQTVRLISPQLSTADLIACNTMQQANMARLVAPSNSNQGTHNSLQCQLCSFVAVSTDALALHVKVNHAPVYSCNYCSFKTKMQDDIKTHLDFQCTLRPPKCYTCLLCNNIIYAVEDIEAHFREKHPKYQLTSGNIPVRMGFVPPTQDTAHTTPTTNMVRRHPVNTNVTMVTNNASLQPMMMTPSRQKDILEGFHLCRYCPFKSQKPSEVNDHMKFGHLNTFDFDRKFSEPEVAVKKVHKPACPGKIDLRASCVESGNFESLEFLPPDSSPTFTSTTVIGRPKCAGKRRQDMSYVIQDKIDSIKCSPKEKNFPCEFCEFKTTTTFNLKRHIKNRHKEQHHEVREDNGVICQYCNEKMTLGNLKRHIKSRHPEMIEVSSAPTVPCPYCEFTTNSSYNLRRHAQKKHRDKFKGLAATPNNSILNNVVCQHCKFRTNSEQSLEKHVKRIHQQPLQASPQASPVKEDPLVVNVVQTPPKEARPPKEKTLSCQSCVFRTAYSQNLRRHYEKNHRDVYPILYPERYAREEAKKATAHTECKTLTISDNSDLARDTPYTGITSPISDKNRSTVASPSSNIICVPENQQAKPVNIVPLSSPIIQSVGEPTPNSTVNSMNTHNSPFLYKSDNVTMATNNVPQNSGMFSPTEIHLHVPHQNNTGYSSGSSQNQIPVQNNTGYSSGSSQNQIPVQNNTGYSSGSSQNQIPVQNNTGYSSGSSQNQIPVQNNTGYSSGSSQNQIPVQNNTGYSSGSSQNQIPVQNNTGYSSGSSQNQIPVQNNTGYSSGSSQNQNSIRPSFGATRQNAPYIGQAPLLPQSQCNIPFSEHVTAVRDKL